MKKIVNLLPSIPNRYANDHQNQRTTLQDE